MSTKTNSFCFLPAFSAGLLGIDNDRSERIQQYSSELSCVINDSLVTINRQLRGNSRDHIEIRRSPTEDYKVCRSVKNVASFVNVVAFFSAEERITTCKLDIFILHSLDGKKCLITFIYFRNNFSRLLKDLFSCDPSEPSRISIKADYNSF